MIARSRPFLAVAIALALTGTVTVSPALGRGRARCFHHKVTIKGTPGDDILLGTTGSDVIRSGKGADSVFGGSGNDFICGKRGDDSLFGDGDTDHVNGGRGVDSCDGETKRSCEEKIDIKLFGRRDADRLDSPVHPFWISHKGQPALIPGGARLDVRLFFDASSGFAVATGKDQKGSPTASVILSESTGAAR